MPLIAQKCSRLFKKRPFFVIFEIYIFSLIYHFFTLGSLRGRIWHLKGQKNDLKILFKKGFSKHFFCIYFYQIISLIGLKMKNMIKSRQENLLNIAKSIPWKFRRFNNSTSWLSIPLALPHGINFWKFGGKRSFQRKSHQQQRSFKIPCNICVCHVRD